MIVVRARLLITTLWVGSLWTVGYVVAPTLFATLADRVLAGTIAGSLFRVEAWLSVACGLMLTLLFCFRTADDNAPLRKTLLRLTLALLVCTLIGYFGLQPFMASIREATGAGGVMSATAKTQFGILHGVASGIYLIQSLLGIGLILRLRTLR
ncbi:DUF4149 domain-containing protein [Glaciimonas immobilis]|uniref:TMEM205-like domain-containing protein n=1 Tax=Glaciimonas immobilis TaxID=728004 RepID=A0A840RQH5_9BURK|nr:DUF4149 domain-containing protein [Glaciimonas immobilis]KAF3999369.1 DUF4149 domain-containing protein [Glaciimonas immobilis]MBB5198861.1 hypothetical protein [Glaciimonas immobilis]